MSMIWNNCMTWSQFFFPSSCANKYSMKLNQVPRRENLRNRIIPSLPSPRNKLQQKTHNLVRGGVHFSSWRLSSWCTGARCFPGMQFPMSTARLHCMQHTRKKLPKRLHYRPRDRVGTGCINEVSIDAHQVYNGAKKKKFFSGVYSWETQLWT